MPGIDQIDVVRALVLELSEQFGEAFFRDFTAHSIAADGKILAEAAPKAAPAKENSA